MAGLKHLYYTNAMKASLVLCFFLVVFNTYSQQQPDVRKLHWLVGTWDQTNVSKPGRTSQERWVKNGSSELQGSAVTLQGSDTLFVEKTTIVIRDNSLYYVADVPGNKEPVFFKFVELTATGFTCENQQHDFPKKISYQLDGNKLKAQISGNGKAIDYQFVRK